MPRGLARGATSVPVVTPATTPKEAKDFVRKGGKVEVLAPSKRWREATVTRVNEGSATVHYTGFDSQFDETIPFSSDRLRPYGDIKALNMHNLKSGFVYQGKMGHCPGCGVKLQCENPEALGFIPRDKFQGQEDAPRNKPLTPEEEVKLLLQEDGVSEQSAFVYPTRATQVTYKVVANVYIDIRKEPDIDAERVEGESLSLGETFEVSEIRQSPDARSYLKLADGRGWVFDWALVKGARMQLIAPVQDAMSNIRQERQSYQKVCQRCWSLWHYNSCDEILRPAFGTPAADELTADKFEEMLTSTLAAATEACILAVVDVFDFGNSFKLLEYLARQIRGKRGIRVRIVANKIDLLPRDVNLARLKGWVAREAQRAGLPKVQLNDVYPLSCHKRQGISAVSKLLEQNDAPPEFYVVGAANAGKSSLLNRLSLRKRKGVGEVAASKADGFMVSALPGTTIQPLVMKYQQGNIRLIDTPGLLVPGSFTERLTLEDLQDVVPQTNAAQRVTLHMEEGRSVFLGGLARLDMVEGRPFQFTLFRSENLKIHQARTEKAMASAERLVGHTLTPPKSMQRFRDSLPWVPHRFELEGAGWGEACADVVFHGLGWVSITGCGRCVVEAHAPAGVEVSVREEPLMPYEAKWTGVKYPGWPGWFKVKGKVTRGFEVGKARLNVKGKF